MANYNRHLFQSPKADGTDATLVRPSNWNAEHADGIQLTSHALAALEGGDVVALDPDHDEGIILADTQDSTQTYVVAQGAVEPLAVGLFTQTGATVVRVNSLTTRGNYLAKSSASKAVYDTGIPASTTVPPIGSLGVALTGAAGPGTVIAHLWGHTVTAAGGKLGDAIASATTLTVPSDVTYVHITGSSTITGISSRAAGTRLTLLFDTGLTLVHNATSFIMIQGVDLFTAGGDIYEFISEGGGNWRQVGTHNGIFGALGAGTIALGTVPATSGPVRLANNSYITWRNATNTGNITGLGIDVNNWLLLSPTGVNIVPTAPIRCDINGLGRLVLPVGPNKYVGG